MTVAELSDAADNRVIAFRRQRCSHAMLYTVLDILALLAAIGSGLVAGTFFIFSVTIMRALDARPVAEAVAAMQAINRIILRSSFIPVFLGTSILALASGLAGLVHWESDAGKLRAAAAALYIVFSLWTTRTYNVPLNNGLDLAEPEGLDEAWRFYADKWTRWNHVRAVASTLAMAGFAASLAVD